MTEQHAHTYGQQRRRLVDIGGPIKAEIRETLTSPIELFAQRVEAFVRERPGDVNRLAHYHAVDRVPYSVGARRKDGSRAMVVLPPDLNEPFRSQGYRVPPIPTSEAGLEEFMRQYRPYRFQQAPVLSPGIHAMGPEQSADLKEELRRMIQNGDRIDPQRWLAYEQVHRDQQERTREGRGICMLHNDAALRSIRVITRHTAERGFFDYTNAAYEDFLMAPTSSPFGVVTPLRAPISEEGYGEALTRKLLRTWAFMVDFAGQDTATLEAFGKLVGKHRDVTEKHMFRTMDEHLPGAEEGTIASLQEGLSAMFSIIFLHTAELMERHEDDPNGAVAQICKDDLINGTTGIAGLDFANPMILRGRRVKKPNKYVGDRLTYSDDLKERLGEMSRLSDALQHQAWVDFHERLKEYEKIAKTDPTAVPPAPPVRFGGPCPVFGQYKDPSTDLWTPGAISRLTPTIKAVFDCIDLLPDDQTGRGYPWDIPRFVPPIEGEPPIPSIAGRVVWLANQGRIDIGGAKEVFALPADMHQK